MYTFRDTIETSEENILPSEALMINGEYIENQISGYRTLNVSGREALSSDVVSYTTGVRDGSRIKSKRYPERIIIVKYQLLADSNEAFREAYNKLGGILDVEEAELIFNDEQDKFYIGTPCVIGEVPPGTNSVVGEIEILCADPFKYSVVEYEAEPELDESSILIDYGGTYKAFPTLVTNFYVEDDVSEDGITITRLTGEGDCGYVAFFTEDEKIIQLGDPDEAGEEEAYAKSQTLVNSNFSKSTSWESGAQSLWDVNAGVTTSDATQVGTVGMKVASYAVTGTPATTSGTLLTATSKANALYINYKVTAKASGRTANSVKVSVAITGSLGTNSSYFLSGYILNASIYIGGAWRNATLKKSTDKWRGKTGHTVNLTFTVTGLSETTNALTGIKFKVTRGDSYGTAGILSETTCKNLTISKYVATTPETYYLAPSSFGTGSKWHGASITRVLPADAAGDVGAANFTLTFSQKMSIGSGSAATNQIGAFQALLTSGSGDARKIVAGVSVEKSSSGKKAKMRFYVNGAEISTRDVDISNNNKYFQSGKNSTITKNGELVTFNVGGYKKTFRDETIEATAVNEITFSMLQFGAKTALEYNGLYWAKFVKNNCDTMKDIPNKFSTADILEADCRNGEIYLNGALTPSLGALGNDWEDFYLTPGLNQIGYSYSDWVKAECAPSVKVRYREVFL